MLIGTSNLGRGWARCAVTTTSCIATTRSAVTTTLDARIFGHATGPVCNQYSRMGYCNYVGSQCARTCAGVPTDRYSNCAQYARLPGYCTNPNIRFQPSGLSVGQSCPDSCRGRTTQLATESQLQSQTRQPAIDVGLFGEEPHVDPPEQTDLRGEEAKVERPALAASDGLA